MTPAPSTNATLAAMRAQRVALARTDLASFLEFVLRDESSGRSIALAPFHEEQIRLTQAHRRLVLWAAIEHGKSSLHTVGRVLFELGCDPTKRIAVVSNTQGQARKFIAAITRYIETSPELAEVFPHLKPGSRWGADAITVARRSFAKDPSVQGIGVHGNVLGARLDLIIMDDVLDFESCRTDEQRRLTIDWTHATLLGRLVEHGRIVVLGTAQHPSDLMHYLAANGWPAHRFAVEDEHGLPRWPERWSEKRIAEKRVELGPMEAARQLDCLARADSSSRFQESWIVDACRRGLGRPPVPYILNVRPPSFTVCGVDLAVSEKRNSDLTAISSVLVHGNGHRELLAVETGKWSAPEILKRIQRVNAAYQPRLVVVESNAAQMYISAMLREWTSIPVKFHLGKLREPENQLAAESHFAALMAEARSVAQYAAKEKGWPKVNTWEATLAAEDRDAWRVVVGLRNEDIHEKPVVPKRTHVGGHWPPGHWPEGHWPENHWPTIYAQTVTHPGGRAEVLKLGEASLRVVNQLLADYDAL